MEEWKTYKLGDLATVKGGKRLPKGVALMPVANSHPYIRIRDLGQSRILDINPTFEYVDDETQKSISRYIVNSGDVILSIVGTIGLTGIIGQSLDGANLTENCVKLVNLKGLEPRYLYYYLSSPIGQAEIKKGIVGAVQPKLPIKNIQDISISIPSADAQKRIADTLSSFDQKIELNNRINHNLEEQSQALYKSWFVDFEPFKDDKFVDSELGMIPEGWKVLPFSAFVQISNEKVDSKHIPEFSVTNTGIFPRDAKFNKRLSSSSLTNKVIRKGDLVFGMSREILNWGIMDEVIGGVSSAYTVYKIEKHIIDENYLRSYIQHHIGYFKDLIKPAAREGQGIDKKVLASKMAIIPEESIWNGFQKKVNSIIAAKRQLMNQTEQLAKLRDEMLPILMGRKAV